MQWARERICLFPLGLKGKRLRGGEGGCPSSQKLAVIGRAVKYWPISTATYFRWYFDFPQREDSIQTCKIHSVLCAIRLASLGNDSAQEVNSYSRWRRRKQEEFIEKQMLESPLWFMRCPLWFARAPEEPLPWWPPVCTLGSCGWWWFPFIASSQLLLIFWSFTLWWERVIKLDPIKTGSPPACGSHGLSWIVMTAESNIHELKVFSAGKRCLKGSVTAVTSKAGAEKCPVTDSCALGIRDACERQSHPSICSMFILIKWSKSNVGYYCGRNREGKIQDTVCSFGLTPNGRELNGK